MNVQSRAVVVLTSLYLLGFSGQATARQIGPEFTVSDSSLMNMILAKAEARDKGVKKCRSKDDLQFVYTKSWTSTTLKYFGSKQFKVYKAYYKGYCNTTYTGEG